LNPLKRLSVNTFLVAGLLLFCLTVYLGSMISQRNLVFDDAFITYRYARNLANGAGITWNPNEAPVEGYTNFLLVILLAPLIKLGADPLLATRLFSLLATAGICLLLYRLARDEDGASKNSALLIVTTFLLVTNTDFLISLGLETVLYTAALFGSFFLGAGYLQTDNPKLGYLLGFSAFAAFLLRPEAVFLVAAWMIVTGIAVWKKGFSLNSLFAALTPVGLSFFLPLLVYLLWKYLYFGDILPNPFYLKASTAQLYSPLGVSSIGEFITRYSLLIGLALLSFFTPEGASRPGRWLAALFSLFCLVFYLRVDTLMDKGGRFLYPVAIFLVYLAIPILARVYHTLLLQTQRWSLKVPLLLTAFILVFNPNSVPQALTDFSAIFHNNPGRGQSPLMLKEYQVALALSQYPRIKTLRIAFGDAGVIPYFSQALSLDDVGLNDRFIATHTDLGELTDYYFAQQPDLAMLTSDQDHAWMNNGHGHLGNFAKWSRDKRWDGYSYVGTLRTEGYYDIQLFVRNDLENFTEFKTYLQTRVVDGVYTPFPLPIGSYKPDKNTQPVWNPLSTSN
jgi:hypothetical protein